MTVVCGGLQFCQPSLFCASNLVLSDDHLTLRQNPTFEPPKRGAGFSLKANWPGLELILLGGIFYAWVGSEISPVTFRRRG